MTFDTKTKRFTTPHAEELAYLAALVAVEAPARANKWASTARIPWDLVEHIRDTLSLDGFDWKQAAIERKHREDERKRAANRYTQDTGPLHPPPPDGNHRGEP